MNAGQIRVLNLLPGAVIEDIWCELRVVTLDSSPGYSALSYVWGSSSKQLTIRRGPQSIPVTDNLHAALRRLRLPNGKRTLWVDALCINQQDDVEKTQQVNMMHEIFGQCTECIVWLGDIVLSRDGISDADAKAAFELFEMLAQDEEYFHNDSFDLPPCLIINEGRNAVRQAITKFRECSSWQHMWTVQEGIMSRSGVLLWGGASASWRAVRQGALNWISWPDDHRLVSLLLELGFGDVIDYYLLPVLILHNIQADVVEQKLFHCRIREATDPRDKFYGLTAIFRDTTGGWPFPRVPSCDYQLDIISLYKRIMLDC